MPLTDNEKREMPERETFVTFVAMNGRIGHAPDNREGRILIPNGADTKRRSTLFYMMHGDIAPNGDIYVPGTRNAKTIKEFFPAVEKFRNDITALLEKKGKPTG